MKVKRVTVIKTFMSKGKIKTSKYTTEVKNIEKYFDNTIESAQYLAETKKGKLITERKEGMLYINYLDVPNDNTIDIIRMVIDSTDNI